MNLGMKALSGVYKYFPNHAGTSLASRQASVPILSQRTLATLSYLATGLMEV